MSTQTVFRKGEIFVRDRAENVPIRYAHWQGIPVDKRRRWSPKSYVGLPF